MYSCGSLAPKMRRGGGCADHLFRKPAEPWEKADGWVEWNANHNSWKKEFHSKTKKIVKGLPLTSQLPFTNLYQDSKWNNIFKERSTLNPLLLVIIFFIPSFSCVDLVAELSGNPKTHKEVISLIPLVSQAAHHKHYTQHLHLMETVCTQVTNTHLATTYCTR